LLRRKVEFSAPNHKVLLYHSSLSENCRRIGGSFVWLILAWLGVLIEGFAFRE
jgi:hypothetical protein